MTTDIQLLDDAFPAALYDELSRLISSEPLSYGARSNALSDPHGHWSRKFVPGGAHNLADIAGLLRQKEELCPLNAAWEHLKNVHLQHSVLIRCYLNGYTYGTDGYFHTDSDRKDESTVVVFMNETWDPDWAGELAFLDAAGDILKSILPRRNRAVIFPASLSHAGRSVSRQCVELRKTLIFKARRERSPDFERLSAFLVRHGATACRHKASTLHDQMVRTFAILEASGFAAAVKFGGGLHAIYGTNEIEHALLSAESRPMVADEFGREAEELAHLLSLLDRPATLASPSEASGGSVPVRLRGGKTLLLPRKVFDDLRKIECACLEDQGAPAAHPGVARPWDEHGKAGGVPGP